MIRKLVLGVGVLGLLAGCSANAADDASSASSAAVSETELPLNCGLPGQFGQDVMEHVGDATYVRTGAAPSNGMKSFTLGPLEDIPGWGGKHADYTRDMSSPCLDFHAIGDGSGVQKGVALPMTEAGCAGQKGKVTVMMDNPAIGAFVEFEDASGLPAGKDFFFVTGSKQDSSGKVSALCLANGTTGDHFLATRQ